MLSRWNPGGIILVDGALRDNHGTKEDKLHIQSVLLVQENTPDMKFVFLGALVVVLRSVEVGHVSFRIPVKR